MSVITLEDSQIIAVTKMSEGNPGALTVLMELLKNTEHGLISIMHLDDMDIRGWKIWVGYKNYCKNDLKKFYDLIMSRDAHMIQFINEFR